MKPPDPFLAYLAAAHGYIDGRCGSRRQRARKGLQEAYNRGYEDGLRVEAERQLSPPGSRIISESSSSS